MSVLNRAFVKLMALAVACAAVTAGDAAEVAKGTATLPGGATVDFTYAETNWVKNAETGLNELVMIFSNTAATAKHSFTLKGQAKADLLVVGGGGAGASGGASSNSRGVGGGGGAGGLIDTNLVFATGTYTITVGAGGAAGVAKSGVVGEDGQPTTVTSDNASFAPLTAVGGGGGGIESDGRPGGSGGGGSKAYTSSSDFAEHYGGAGTPGQGNRGGHGLAEKYSANGRSAGAGGGAGGPGEDVAKANTGTTGGAGTNSWITGKEVWYAAGGGGGTATATADNIGKGGGDGAGGNIIGGSGAGGSSTAQIAATDGKPGTGSGGGGGSFVQGGGAGGSGIVIVRISAAAVGPLVKPVSQEVAYDAKSHLLVEKSPFWSVLVEGAPVDKVEETDAGEYPATVKLVEGFTWSDGTDDAVDVTLTITAVETEITNLRLENWTEKPVGEPLPEPTCDVNVPGVKPVYTYGVEDDITKATGKQPTAAGDYYVFASVAAGKNWSAATASAPFSILKSPRSVFTDNVGLAIAPYVATGKDPKELTNFPYRVVLSTSSPPGFDYARAGATGENLGFADADGNYLKYFVESWDPNGESVLYVRVPMIGNAAETITLFWKVVDGETPPPYEPETVFEKWTKAEADAFANKPTSSYGLVERDGKKVDAWVSDPEIEPTTWGVTTDPGEAGQVKSLGALASGRAVKYVLYDAEGQPLDPQEMPLAEGVYYALFSAKEPSAGYIEPEPKRIDLRVIDRAPYRDLSDGAASITLGGRVMLANGDSTIEPKIAFDEGQAYWQVRSIRVSGRTQTFNPFWTHEGEHETDSLTIPYLWDGVTHKLCHLAADGVTTNVLWRLDDVMFGNTYQTSKKMSNRQCYLPASPTAYGTSTYANRSKVGDVGEIGQMVMRNWKGAVICSPCYTNGIGTIYFDAVNAHTAAADEGAYCLKVQMATVTKDGLPATDDNAGEELENITDAEWKDLAITPLKCVNGKMTKLADTNEVPLDITVGGTDKYFYRLCVKVNEPGVRRFRIIRTTDSKPNLYGTDFDRLILIDNIIVSYPTSDATVKPYGVFDASKRGKRTLGREGMMANVAFPSVADDALVARGELVTNVAQGVTADPSTFVQLSKFHYRWRYLNQMSNAWDSVDLRPGSGFVAETPLKLPAEVGDVEFWYETYTKIPFYDYVDYSGSGLKLGGQYTEEVGMRYYPENAPEGGTEFVRLRAGRSDWNGVNVVLQGVGFAFGRDVPMELVGDHSWRGLVQMPTNVVGDVNFWFAGGQRWEAGATEPAESDTVWYPLEAVTNGTPAHGETSIGGRPQPFRADAATGYMEFQFNDVTGAFTLGHAEYQDFNAWHDAKHDYFSGTYVETNGVNVTDMLTTNAHMRTWEPLRVTDSNWDETFYLTDYSIDAYKKFVSYATHKMPHQWSGDNGMFVDAELTGTSSDNRKYDSGLAWKMQGYGLGSLSFTQSDVPNGLDTVKFRARLEQSVAFEDFSYCYAGDMMSAGDYTFLIPAIMSCASKSGLIDDFAPGASMSVVGFYTPMKGCYEFRVERNDSKNLRFSIYKWYRQGYRMVCEAIGSHLFSSAAFWHTSGTSKPNMYGMFISLGEDEAGKTTIIGGLTQGSAAPNSAYCGASSNPYRAIRCIDDSATRHTSGTIGVLSTGCNGLFLTARRYSQHLPASVIDSYKTAPSSAEKKSYPMFESLYNYSSGKSTFITAFAGTRDEDADIKAMQETWACAPGRIELYENTAYKYSKPAVGFRPPADLGQTVDLYLKSSDNKSTASDDAAWALKTNVIVTSYGWKDYTVTVRTNMSCHVMLKPGDAPTDVAVGASPNGRTATSGGVLMTAWNGADMANPPDRDFMFTQANVFEETKTEGDVTVTNRYCKLQPARAVATKPVSVRAPVLDHGLGMIGFSYRDVKPGAEIWVQLSTNDVLYHLTGTDGLNQSVREGAGPGEWETVRKYTYEELSKTTEQKLFLGYHDRIGQPLVGVLRVVVAPSVVEEAARRVIAEPEYGSITLTDVFVQDEPAIDTGSWLGWNLRTVGDREDSERRMYLPDCDTDSDVGFGLSSALNDSTNRDIDPDSDPSEYAIIDPTIQSPTFRAKSIGYVRFRARVYDNSGVVGEPATVTLYGTVNSAQDDWGTVVTNFTVTSPRFEQFEYRAGRERYTAVRLAVRGVTDGKGDPKRVLLDEVVVSEKTESTVGFVYARPFRSRLNESVALPESEVMDMCEQPLAGESWGVQAKLKLDQFEKDIDVKRGFRVTLRTFVGETPWGYTGWCNEPAASDEAELTLVDPDNLVFRSTVDVPASVVKPVEAANTVVQYMLTAYYYLKNDETEYPAPIEVSETEGSGWTNPTWYAPVDKNAGKAEAVPYTILDGMSPGRAWINEVNYNDGTKADGGGAKSTTNQFIEIAVPWGVDMKGWYVQLADYNNAKVKLATFGYNGVPSVKNKGEHSGDYGFLVLQSPGTRDAGGIRDASGQAVADGTWSSESLDGTLKSGKLENYQAYQLSLHRPSGILEHQFVIGGTNEYAGSSWAVMYDGTNLLHDLNAAEPSPRRFYAGDDPAFTPERTALASFGVTGGAHGEAGGWSDEMRFTPGHRNEFQDPLTGWYLRPNGESIWIYARVEESSRGNVVQRIGEDTAQDTLAIVRSGGSTNIVYSVRPWYAVNAVGVNDAGKTNYVFTGTGANATFNFNNVTETIHVTATEAIDPRVLRAGLDPSDAYAPAIMKWLRDGSLNGSFKNPDGPLTNAIYRGLSADATNVVMGLKGMYWFDIDPTEPGWWLRGGFVDLGFANRTRKFNPESKTPYTNPQIGVKLYLSNDVSQAVYAPKRLQGLNNERSDDPATYASWTSVTFKVEACLENGRKNAGYLPFRWFTFGPDSFVKPENALSVGRPAYSTKIEILDPFSLESPGYSYGWRDYRGSAIMLRWNVTESLAPSGVELLKADSTYEGSPLFE